MTPLGPLGSGKARDERLSWEPGDLPSLSSTHGRVLPGERSFRSGDTFGELAIRGPAGCDST